MSENYSMSVVCVGADRTITDIVRETLALTLPGIVVRDLAASQGRDTTKGDIAIVCEPTPGSAIDSLRLLRASGFANAALLVADINGSSPDVARWGPARTVTLADFAGSLPALLAELADEDARRDDAVYDALRRTRRVVAAGEIALGLQHAINNPLTALLAEAQLLEFEELPPDHREAVERIVTQTRRVIEIVRGLDGISERRS